MLQSRHQYSEYAMAPSFLQCLKKLAKEYKTQEFGDQLAAQSDALRSDPVLSSQIQDIAIYHNNVDLLHACVLHTDVFAKKPNFVLFLSVIGTGHDDVIMSRAQPAEHFWDDVLEEMCLCECYADVVTWCRWNKSANLLDKAISKLNLDYAHPDARSALVHLEALRTNVVLQQATIHAGQDRHKGLKL